MQNGAVCGTVFSSSLGLLIAAAVPFSCALALHILSAQQRTCWFCNFNFKSNILPLRERALNSHIRSSYIETSTWYECKYVHSINYLYGKRCRFGFGVFLLVLEANNHCVWKSKTQGMLQLWNTSSASYTEGRADGVHCTQLNSSSGYIHLKG